MSTARAQLPDINIRQGSAERLPFADSKFDLAIAASVGLLERRARLDPAARDEPDPPGVRDGDLIELFGHAGLGDAGQTALRVSAAFANLDEWWYPFPLGVGPAGARTR